MGTQRDGVPVTRPEDKTLREKVMDKLQENPNTAVGPDRVEPERWLREYDAMRKEAREAEARGAKLEGRLQSRLDEWNKDIADSKVVLRYLSFGTSAMLALGGMGLGWGLCRLTH